jgi:hypothetical protein
MEEKMFCVLYDLYVCGGKGNPKIALANRDCMSLYESETDMLKDIIKMNKENSYGNIRPFIMTQYKLA